MAIADPSIILPEEQYTSDSLYGAYRNAIASGGALDGGYGKPDPLPSAFPLLDNDPFGVKSTSLAEKGTAMLTSDIVTGLTLPNGTWKSRDELMKTDSGRSLVEAEEDIRRGNKRGFWDAITKGSWTDFVPFVGMLASVGGSLVEAHRASDFFRKAQAGETTTDDEAISAATYLRENKLNSDGTWGYTFGSIIRQAPAFCLEFGILGSVGAAARAKLVGSLAKETTEEAAASMARYGYTRAVKTGADEIAESAVREFVKADMANNVGRTMAQSVQGLASNPALMKDTVGTVRTLTHQLVDSGLNAIAGMERWTPAIQAKSEQILAESAVKNVIARMSSDSVVKNAWKGYTQSVQRALADGFMDLGEWGTEAATTINTGIGSAKRAAVDAVNQLTFGALARGTALYLPKEAVTRTVGALVGGKNRNALSLEAAAWQNDDDGLMSKAEMYGAFLDLLEYVSENTGRGFNSAGRAIGLAVAPGLMKPASKIAGLTHIANAVISKDAAGEATGVVYNGLSDIVSSAEAGGKLHQFLTKLFGSRALKENVAADKFNAAKYYLGKKLHINVADADVALQKTLDSGVVQSGLAPEVERAIGGDVNGFIRTAFKAANKGKLDGMHYRAFQTFYIADFMARHNIDAIAAGDAFRKMGYDGIVGEMMEERYTDFVSALFGLDARQDHSFWNNMKRAVEGAFMVDPDTGKFQWDQLTAEAAAFAVPMLAKAGTMRAVAAMGGPNALSRFKGDSALWSTATRYGNVQPIEPGEYLETLQARADSWRKQAAASRKMYDDEIRARAAGVEAKDGVEPRAPVDDLQMKKYLDDEKMYTRAADRIVNDTKRAFMEQLAATPVAEGEKVIVPVISDQEYLAPDEVYNLSVKSRADQGLMRQASSASQRLVDDAPFMFQTLAKMEDRDRVKEDAGWFRRASHWVVEHAIRLGGFAVTGDTSMLHANPARFSAVDMGVPEDMLTMGKRLYVNAFRQNVEDLQGQRVRESADTGSPVVGLSQEDVDRLHAKTLSDISEPAKQLMTAALAAHQARMFSTDELRDLAIDAVAKEDNYVVDAASRTVVSKSDNGATTVPLGEYLQQDGVADRVKAIQDQYTKELFYILSGGEGSRRILESSADSIRTVSDILTIPRDLPTARQAIIAKLLTLPQFRGSNVFGGHYRGTVLAREADGSRSLDDHFDDGIATDKKWADAVLSVIYPAGSPAITANTDMEEIYAKVGQVHPAILASIARELHLPNDGTRKGIENRDREIAKLAIMQTFSVDQDVVLFTRPSTVDERESREFTSPFGFDAPARRFSDGHWEIRITPKDSRRDAKPITAGNLEELKTRLEPFGFSAVTPKIVFTSYQVLQSSSVTDMVRVLGLGSLYHEAESTITDQKYLDPALRRLPDNTKEFKTEEEADAQREKERVLASMYEDRKSADPELYLRPGERQYAADGKTTTPEWKRACRLAEDCVDCWNRRNRRSSDGRSIAQGYIAVADDLVRQYGVAVPYSASDNRFGTASQGRRGKYVLSIRSLQSRGLSRNVYVPISHVNAQDYGSALLDAALFNAYSRNRVLISEVERSQTVAFMDHVNAVCLERTRALEKDNPELAAKIEDFRLRTVARDPGKVRMPSPGTFAEFVSAFNLFRTEVPNLWKATVLGADAEVLCAIAPNVRAGTAYVGWTGLVDRVLGGSGLEVAALKNGEVPADGIGRFYAMWAPKGSGTLDKAIEATRPGQSFAEFAEKATREAQATVQSAVNRENEARAKVARSLDVAPAGQEPPVMGDEGEPDIESPEPPVPPNDPLGGLHVAQQVARQSGLTPIQTMDVLAKANDEGTVFSDVYGGVSEMPEQGGSYEDAEENDDRQLEMRRQEEFVSNARNDIPATAPARDRVSSMTPSEVTQAAKTLSAMASVMTDDGTVDEISLRKFLHRIIANPRKEDVKRIVDAYRELRAKEEKDGTVVTDAFGLNAVEDDNDEGAAPDGADKFNQKAVDMLRSKVLGNLLAMFDLVSPQTGRDFQPLVEDLRSMTRAVGQIMPDRSPDLIEADAFLTSVINPRGDVLEDNAADRDTAWREKMRWFEQSSGHRPDIVRYVRAYMGEEGKPPVNARAALLLSYLLTSADAVRKNADGTAVVQYDKNINARMSIATLIGSSAAAQPVQLGKTVGFGTGDNFNFILSPRRMRGGSNEMDAVTGSFARLSRKTGTELVKIAADLRAKFLEVVPKFESLGLYAGTTSNSIFYEYARILAPVFGFDSPIVSVFLSRPLYGFLNTDTTKIRSSIDSGFRDVVIGKNGPAFGGLPVAAFQIVDMIESMGKRAGAKTVSGDALEAKAVELFRDDAPARRAVFHGPTSLQDASVWMKLFRSYSNAKPVSIMRADVDPERSSQPASSLAITMPGVEPAVQEFMDRRDENGYEAVVRQWFPDRFEKLTDDEAKARIADYRQRMVWPSRGADLIVAKSVSKSALASEILNGCETAYKADGARMAYVPVYSGDHSSSIIIQVPLADKFKGAGMTYDDVASMVSRWVGLDLLGTDPKRSGVTCLEGPGTSMRGVRTERRQVVDFTGTWTREQVEADTERVYLFGDNTDDRLNTKYVPSSTQAVIRGLPNAIGIDTKRDRGTAETSYFTDNDFDQFKAQVDSAIQRAKDSGKTVVLPANGIGTGKAQLRERAPRLFAYLQEALASLKEDPVVTKGHAYVSIVWNSEPGANNEAMIGTSGIVGYGARRQKELAKDMNSSTIKVHVSAVGPDRVYGPLLTLIKSLAVSPLSEGGRGQFLACSPNGMIFNHAYDIIRGQEDISSCTITDFDSIKLSQANSKTVGVDKGDGKPYALMKHVFDRLAEALEKEGKGGDKVESVISGDDLDRLVGDIKWVDKGGSGKDGVYKVSQLLAGAKIREVKRPDDYQGPRMFSLVFEADNQMAFQVANVSHVAHTEFTRTPRNYMTDSMALSRTLGGWNGDVAGNTSVFRGGRRVCDNIRELVTSWGFTAAAVSSQMTSVNNLLTDDEEYQYLMDHGGSAYGDLAQDLRQRKYAAVARRDNLAIRFNNQVAPLVTNAGWIGNDGRAHSHSTSRMFNDTLQGARTIRLSDREFMRGNKRAAIVNVNNSDKSFRHGMYVDEPELLNTFSDVADALRAEDGAAAEAGRDVVPFDAMDEYHRVVRVLERVVETIVAEENNGTTQRGRSADDWRKALASCLIDHHGNRFSDRTRPMRVTVRGEDGKPMLDANGRAVKKDVRRPYYEYVSYADLMTEVTCGKSGEMQFDRTAVYPAMYNDATKRNHVYLGGTMMGLPRTPSYNGAQWCQVVRAGLPVTELADEPVQDEKTGKTTVQWECGLDSMVAPDPYTLAILGCDHDGDKTNLYMLKPGKRGVAYADLGLLTSGVDDLIRQYGIAAEGFRHLSSAGRKAVEAHVQKLIDAGYAQYDKRTTENADGTKTERVLGLSFTESGKSQFSNSFVSGLFDMYRMLPVSDNSDTEAPVFDGFSDHPGSTFRGVKAQPCDTDTWKGIVKEEEKKEHGSMLGDPLLDAASGKILAVPKTATAVQDGAAIVSDARAIIVSMAGALHFAYASGLDIGPFSTRKVSEKDWIDFMYHVDGLSNMTFDDIKEQICTRLGIKPNMIQSILADIINTADAGHLPTTDAQFIEAFRKYGTEANDESKSRYWMARASDVTDYRFRYMFQQSLESESTSPLLRAKEIIDLWAKDVSAGKSVEAVARIEAMADSLKDKMDNAIRSIKSPVNGFTYWLSDVAKPTETSAAIEDFARWTATMDQLSAARDYGNAVNYAHVDPASNMADAEAERLMKSWDRVTKRLIGSADPRLAGVSKEVLKTGRVKLDDKIYRIVDQKDLDRATRMRAATALMYNDAMGSVIAARGIRAAQDFDRNLRTAVKNYGRSTLAPGESIRETLAVSALAACPRLWTGDPRFVMRCEANMQSVPWAMAAVNTTPVIPGSPLNARNLYDVLEHVGRVLASRRHRDTAGNNRSLDVRYGVESMLDIVSRLVTNSTAHDVNQVFDYIRETPDANAFGYTPDKYGDAARGLSRARTAFDRITEAQRDTFVGLYERAVIGRELDSDRIGSTYTSTTGYSPKYGLNFSLSVANLGAYAKFLKAQEKRIAAEISRRKSEDRHRALVSGSERDIMNAVDEMLNVFRELEKKFGKGFSIEPSALLGQVLPFYACMTDRVTGVATNTRSLVGIMPDWVFARLDREVSRMHNDPEFKMWADMLSAVDWSPRVVTEVTEDDVGTRKTTRRFSARKTVARNIRESEGDLYDVANRMAHAETAEEYWAAFKAFKALAGKTASGKDANGRKTEWEGPDPGVEPEFHHTLALFDGARGVAFRSLTGTAMPRRASVGTVKPVAQAPAVTPAAAAPVETVNQTPDRTPSPIEAHDERTYDMAMRMSGLLKMWDAGRVEYKGGKKFTIFGRFHDDSFETPFETRIDVEVKDGNSILTDRQVMAYIDGPRFLQSLSQASGKTVDELRAMSRSDRFAFAKKFGVSGSSVTYRPGTTETGMPEIGAWAVDAKALMSLSGKIEIAADSGDPDTIYHEYFHSVMGFMRTLGSLSGTDVKNLIKRYGESTKYGDRWFNEEKAAADFKEFVRDTFNPKADNNSGLWSRVKAFVEDLLNLVFNLGEVDSSAYANDMGTNPLAAIVLTGRVHRSGQTVESRDISARITAAVETAKIQLTMHPGKRPIRGDETAGEIVLMASGDWDNLDPAVIRGMNDFITRVEETGDLHAISEEFNKNPPVEVIGLQETGNAFGTDLFAVLKEYGPQPIEKGTVEKGASDLSALAGAIAVVPNHEFESDVGEFLQPPADVEPVDTEVVGLEDEPYLELNALHEETEHELSRVIPQRMNRPYNPANSLALEIGKAIAANLDPSVMDPATAETLNRDRKVAFDDVQRRVALNAVMQVGSLFGVDMSDSDKVERMLFKALNELYAKAKPDLPVNGTVSLADGGTVGKETLVTPNALSSAIVTACGVRPCDIMDLTIEDVRKIADRHPTGTFRTNVIDPILRDLALVKTDDPCHVRIDLDAPDPFGALLSRIEAGLTRPGLDENGMRRDFELGKAGTSKNPNHDINIAAYADHVSNPDFQLLMHTVLDRLYTLQAANRWYRQIGMEPGDPRESLAIRGIMPEAAPEPLTQGDAMADAAVSLEQLADPAFRAVEYYDQPAFIANHPDAWLDSVMRPNFGGTNLRESAQEEKRQVAGFHTRANNLDGLLIRGLGLDVMPGGALTAIDKDYASQFAMEQGRTVHKNGAHAIKFLAYEGKKAKGPDGSVITADITDQRRADFTYKMWKVLAQNGEFMVTGVDRLVFGASDVADPAHYTIEKVRERAQRGIAADYTDFDRFLNRMYRQLHDDEESPWEDITGESGLNLYNRVVDSACRALAEAQRLAGTQDPNNPAHTMLNANEINDFVLRSMTNEGLIQSVEKRQPGHRGFVRTEGVLVVSAREWSDFWKKSSTYAKLRDAGRDERLLDFDAKDSVAGQLVGLFNEVRRFVDAHPYLSDGDGAFFHNVSTPLPWVGGSGYFMYAANRNARELEDLEKTTETLGQYEKTFNQFVGTLNAVLPAASADDNMMRLFGTLFHTDEHDPEAIRAQMATGEYAEAYGLSADATQRDLALMIYDRLEGMILKRGGDPLVERLGGRGAVGRMLRYYRRHSLDDASVVAGGSGMKDDVVYRTTGVLPANYQLGHAVKHAIDGITNAFAFRATLFNMLTTPDEDGNPTCYARPADDAQEAGGLSDSMWGVVARWWAKTNGWDNEYDIQKSGVQNAQHIYDLVAQDTKNGVRKVKDSDGRETEVKFGELSNSEIDPRSITAFMAKDENPEDGSSIGHYALGYAKHLFQSTRTLGTSAAMKQIHRAWAWSKGLSVNFSYFFPLATRFESPFGAVGAVATLGGNFAPDWVRRHPEALSRLQSLFKGNGWITKDFIGQRDVFDMLDSNDPYLSELYHWAGVLGIQLSDPDVNPQEHSRAVLQQDLDRVVGYVKDTMGTKAARHVKEIMGAVLLKGGDRAFTYHLNATKLAVTAQLCTKLQVLAEKNGVAFDPVRDLKRYSAYLNAEIGGIDPLQFAWAHPVMQSRMNALFFSWGWTRGAWEAGGGTAIEQVLFGGHDVTPEQRKQLIGRWTRMFGEVMIGVPILFQVLGKSIGKLLTLGLDPDDDQLTEEERKRRKMLLGMVDNTPWFPWGNEDKTWMTNYDITPIMAGVSARFPGYSKFVTKDHPWFRVGAGLAATGMHGHPLAQTLAFLGGAAPTYEGTDERNGTTMGRRYYQHFGKQGWEWTRWFTSPVKQFLSKLAMPIQRLMEGVVGRSLTFIDHPQPWEGQGDIERWFNPTFDGATFNLLRAFVPFSMVSLYDTSDAGVLSMAAPVTMGESASGFKKKLAAYLDDWSSNDRKGYAFGGMSRRSSKQKMGKVLAKNSVTVAHLLHEARMNGFSEKESYELVDNAIASLTSKLYGELLNEMPTEPDGKFDVREMSKLLRKSNRLGRIRKDMFKALKNRLEKQNRWGLLRAAERQRMRDILRFGTRGGDAYDIEALDKVNDMKYDY